MKVTCEGRPHLGAALGIDVYIESHVKSKVTQWVKELELLAAIAISQPQTAHAALTHGLSSKWLYLSRMTPKIGHLLKLLELTIKPNCFWQSLVDLHTVIVKENFLLCQ